jgi:hypothetical protein
VPALASVESVPALDCDVDYWSESPGPVEQPFLLARLVADQLRAHPINTTTPGWQSGVADSIYGCTTIYWSEMSRAGTRLSKAQCL